MKKIMLLLFVGLSFVCSAQIDKIYGKDAAEMFVKQNINYSDEAVFSSSVVVESETYNKGVILGQFDVKNVFGVKIKYTYKIWLSYDGSRYDLKNWKYSKLILEDSNGKQTVINPSKRKDTSVRNVGNIDGIKCQVYESNEYFSRIETSKKLTKAQIKRVPSELKISTNIIYFHLPSSKKASTEYANKVGDVITVF